MDDSAHLPVLVEEVVELLAPPPSGIIVDATVGLGGHAEALLARVPELRLVGLDVDEHALALAARRLAPFARRATLLRRSYWELADALAELGIDTVDGVLFDLGVSSLQLDTPARGFSFRHDAPLDMRFSGEGETAAELLERLSEDELVRVLSELGEEPRARRVARAIARARARGPIATTGELRRVVAGALGYSRSRIDPATRTFQALRLAVNRELEGIAPALDRAVAALAPRRRMVVISFHSLEDRIVKQTLRRLSGRCVCPPGAFACSCGAKAVVEILTPRPVRPSERELRANPRARSARLRAAMRGPA